MIIVKPLTGIDIAIINSAWQDAFKDYPVSWTKTDIEKMLVRRGYVPELSFGAFEGDELVSFTLNCVGEYDGMLSAYDTGTGTRPAFRGRSLAARIFHAAEPFLKQQNIKQYILDVMQDNTNAIAVYKKQGLQITREFNYFVLPADELHLPDKALSEGYQVKEIEFPGREIMQHMWDFHPAWQNSIESVLRVPADIKYIGAFAGDTLAGYGITAYESGDITQIAVDQGHRRQGIGTAILRAMLALNTAPRVKAIATDVDCASINLFLEACGLPRKGCLYEMIKELDPQTSFQL